MLGSSIAQLLLESRLVVILYDVGLGLGNVSLRHATVQLNLSCFMSFKVEATAALFAHLLKLFTLE